MTHRKSLTPKQKCLKSGKSWNPKTKQCKSIRSRSGSKSKSKSRSPKNNNKTYRMVCDDGLCHLVRQKPMRTSPTRKSPRESATHFPYGAIRRGVDGKYWKIVQRGKTRAWQRI